MEPLEHTTDDLGRHLEPFDVLKWRNKKGSKLRQAEVYSPLQVIPTGPAAFQFSENLKIITEILQEIAHIFSDSSCSSCMIL